MDIDQCENGGNFAFFPTSRLDGKDNYKQYYFVLPNGKIQKRVFLDVLDDRHREFLICIHYLTWSAKYFMKEGDGIDITGRDCPWDFSLSINKKDHFFVEITSIADNSHHHAVNKREQRVGVSSRQQDITLHEMKKLNSMFPTEEVTEQIRRHQHAGVTDNDRVQNPWFGNDNRLFMSSIPEPDMPLNNLIKAAIESKMAKKHDGKQETVLIIDNRTSLYDAVDVMRATEEMQPFFDECPFREIWFYTGYFSDHDGQNAEYSHIAFKLPPDREKQLLQVTENLHIDQRGRTIMPARG